LKPKDVGDKGISERELKRKKAEIRKGKRLNFKTKVNRTLLKLLCFSVNFSTHLFSFLLR
jgi:hypothetical protein